MYPPSLRLLPILISVIASFPHSLCATESPETVQPLHLDGPPAATIPAFPEQSSLSGCPLKLSDELVYAVKRSCGGDHLHRETCCPVLAAWLYSAYSPTALGSTRAAKSIHHAGHNPGYDLPVLPDDSENCVDGIDRALKQRGLELNRPNETCDVVYCYCGIRLHHLSCPGAFRLNNEGKLVGDKTVEKLEIDCMNSNGGSNEVHDLDGCSKCLNTLYKVNYQKALEPSKADDRTTRMHNKDCRLMGITWLLAKNHSAYIDTVASVLRPIMISKDGSDPQSCTLGSDGMPLAVDSSEISNQSSVTMRSPRFSSILLLCLAWVFFCFRFHFPNIS